MFVLDINFYPYNIKFSIVEYRHVLRRFVWWRTVTFSCLAIARGIFDKVKFLGNVK